jgi:hypothetical protein
MSEAISIAGGLAYSVFKVRAYLELKRNRSVIYAERGSPVRIVHMGTIVSSPTVCRGLNISSVYLHSLTVSLNSRYLVVRHECAL